MSSVSERLADESDGYLDAHDIYGLLSSLLKQLTIAQPADPFPFLIDALQRPTFALRCIVAGSGAVNGDRSAQQQHAAHIASAFGVPLVSADELVTAEIARGSAAGAAAKAARDARKAVDDSVIGALVEARLSQPDCKRNGWVLSGFPNSRSGAQRLAHGGLLATHFLYLTDEANAPGAVPPPTGLHAPSPSAAAHGTGAGAGAGAASSSVSSASTGGSGSGAVAWDQADGDRSAVREFYAHVTTNAGAAHHWPQLERWLSSVTAAEAGPAIPTVTVPNPSAVAAAANHAHAAYAASHTSAVAAAAAVAAGSATPTAGGPLESASVAAAAAIGVPRPRRPLRLAILGPRGAGKSTQAGVIAQALGVVHVSSGQLLRAEVAGRSALADQIAPYLAQGLLVPDDVVTAVVGARLVQSDCKRHGFLLDGYPATARQVAALAAASCVPRRVVVLAPGAMAGSSGHSDSKAAWQLCRDRLVYRRLDPVTGHYYHIKSQPIPAAPIGGRLVQRPADTEEYVKQQTKQYSTNADDVLRAFKTATTTTTTAVAGSGVGATAGSALTTAHITTVDAALPRDAVTSAILQHIHSPLNAQIQPVAAAAAAGGAAATAKAAPRKS